MSSGADIYRYDLCHLLGIVLFSEATAPPMVTMKKMMMIR
jgi:hypothetical protein